MQTIQFEVPDDLAVELWPYRHQLPQLVQAGLQAFRQSAQKLNDETVAAQIRHTLAASGRVRLPLPESVTKPYVRYTPVPITGQPVSEIAIEQRSFGMGPNNPVQEGR